MRKLALIGTTLVLAIAATGCQNWTGGNNRNCCKAKCGNQRCCNNKRCCMNKRGCGPARNCRCCSKKR